jgi:hypothetical protein
VLKFVPLAIIGIVGLFYIEGGNFTPFAPAGDATSKESRPGPHPGRRSSVRAACRTAPASAR